MRMAGASFTQTTVELVCFVKGEETGYQDHGGSREGVQLFRK